MSPRPAGHCDQRAHRRAVALHLGVDADHVARIEVEGLHDVEAVGRVVEGDRGRAPERRPVAEGCAPATVTW